MRIEHSKYCLSNESVNDHVMRLDPLAQQTAVYLVADPLQKPEQKQLDCFNSVKKLRNISILLGIMLSVVTLIIFVSPISIFGWAGVAGALLFFCIAGNRNKKLKYDTEFSKETIQTLKDRKHMSTFHDFAYNKKFDGGPVAIKLHHINNIRAAWKQLSVEERRFLLSNISLGEARFYFYYLDLIVLDKVDEELEHQNKPFPRSSKKYSENINNFFTVAKSSLVEINKCNKQIMTGDALEIEEIIKDFPDNANFREAFSLVISDLTREFIYKCGLGSDDSKINARMHLNMHGK